MNKQIIALLAGITFLTVASQAAGGITNAPSKTMVADLLAQDRATNATAKSNNAIGAAGSRMVGKGTVVSAEVVDRTRHSRKVELVLEGTNSLGQVVRARSHYTALANGMNVFDAATGQYVPAHPVFTETPDGFVGTGAGYSVQIARRLGTRSTIVVTLPNQQTMKMVPTAVSFYDPDTGKVLLLAGTKPGIKGELVSSNQVVFRDAFAGSGIEANIVLTYGAQFEQDLVFTASVPEPPKDFGPRTQLQMISESFDTAEPVKTSRVASEEKDAAKAARMV